jgi:hypothetical protein
MVRDYRFKIVHFDFFQKFSKLAFRQVGEKN